MSYQERQAKKRKTSHSADFSLENSLDTSKPTARFTPQGGRPWTLSVAVPTSILTGLRTAEQRIRIAGQIGRALSVFSVDEVVVFDDRPPSDRSAKGTDPAAYTGDIDPAHFLGHVLEFLECPPFMRKTLFPLHKNLSLAGFLPSLDMPHHPNVREWLPYRDGVAMERVTKSGGSVGTLVDVGLPEPVTVENEIPIKCRVTLHYPQGEAGPVEVVAPDAPRMEAGYYWGYMVRKCVSLSSVFTECPFEDGYDISIGTSERGTPTSKKFPGSRMLDFKHLIIIFGGPRGLEFAAANDAELTDMGIQGRKTQELFDHWVNILPNQGSRTIRTEEALFIGLTTLRKLWNSS